jgi:peptide-methionine (S)-S-oxide reductase
MSWRFLAATGTLVVFLGFTGISQAQDDAAASKAKPAAGTAESPANSGSQSEATPSDAGKPQAKPAAAKAKASTSKTKSKKTSARGKSGSSTNAGSSEPKYELATFGAGCFWHVEADFERLNGVISAVSGYAGGNVSRPNYEMVHEGFTGHAEVVMVQYDPEIISYEDLLKMFWTCHDPTTPNRQGPDVGTQYRSIILYKNEAQKKAALKSYDQLVEAKAFRNPIVTQLVPLKVFYRAEDEHQDYYGGKPRASSRRRTASSGKSKKPLSKVAKALATKPVEDATSETKPADAQAGEAKPAGGDSAGAKDADTKP